VKVSVSIADEDVEFLDRYAAEHGVASRSGVVQRAVSLLRAVELGDDYAAAWADWDGPDAEQWEAVVEDGLGAGGGAR
jgi:Arc/MetJ-type ribon-helix-helix transcriptional regulator